MEEAEVVSISRIRALRAAAGAMAVALAAVASVPPAHAQEEPDPFGRQAPPPEAATLEVSAFGGVLTPLSDLTDDPASFGTVLTAAPSIGAEAVLWFGEGFGAALQGVWAPADLEIRPTDFPGAVPTELGGADWIAGTVRLLYRLELSGAARVIEPFAGVGVGLRHLDVDPQASPEVEDATDPVAAVGAGALVRVTPLWGVRLEVRDYVSSFESPATGDARIQNDLAVSIGAVLRLR